MKRLLRIVSRRDFVTTSAGSVAGALAGLPGCATTPSVSSLAGPVAGSDRIRVALVGCGGRGTGAASQALHADPGAELVALADPFADRMNSCVENLSKEPEIAARVKVDPEHRFEGLDGYLKAIESCDVVLLCAPPHFRPVHLKAAVDAGKHIFCEKPVAVDSTGVRSVLATAAEAKSKKLSLVSGFCWRYSDPERATFGRIRDGAIGQVTTVHNAYLTGSAGLRARKPEWSNLQFALRNWVFHVWLCGDFIVEQDVHSVDKIAWAMGGEMPAKVTATGGRQVRTGADFGNVYDHFSVVYEYASGARAFNHCRQTDGCDADNTDYVIGTKGNCFLNSWGPTAVIKGETSWRYDGPARDKYQVEHDELFASIRAGKPMNDGEWMSMSTLMAIAARMSAYTGHSITWQQALNSKEDFTPKSYDPGIATGPVAMPGRTPLV